jgi:hypothetical protein
MHILKRKKENTKKPQENKQKKDFLRKFLSK